MKWDNVKLYYDLRHLHWDSHIKLIIRSRDRNKYVEDVENKIFAFDPRVKMREVILR